MWYGCYTYYSHCNEKIGFLGLCVHSSLCIGRGFYRSCFYCIIKLMKPINKPKVYKLKLTEESFFICGGQCLGESRYLDFHWFVGTHIALISHIRHFRTLNHVCGEVNLLSEVNSTTPHTFQTSPRQNQWWFHCDSAEDKMRACRVTPCVHPVVWLYFSLGDLDFSGHAFVHKDIVPIYHYKCVTFGS